MHIEDDYTKYFEYLVELRDSGETNMWGASPYLVREFGIDHVQAKTVLLEWIKSFNGTSK